MTEIRRYLSGDKRYLLPDSIKVIQHRSFYIIIAPEKANWIVLSNKKQLEFFLLLRENTIGEATKIFNGTDDDRKTVLLQIEARRFTQEFSTQYNTSSQAHIYLTNACNLKCPHCYMYAGRKLTKELSTIEILDFLEQYHKHGGEKVVLSGGEVCMRRDLFDVVKAAHKEHLFVQLLTNGTMWTHTEIEQISPFLDSVQISVDGYCEEENKKVRGRGNFQKALQTIDYFIANNVPTRIAITPMFSESLENKISEYTMFIKYLINKYAGKPFQVIIAQELLDGRNIKLSTEQRNEYKRIMSIINKNSNGANSYKDFIKARKKGILNTNCAFGDITLFANGDVFFCNRMHSSNLNINIRKDSFDKIWGISQELKKYTDVTNLIPCNECELKYICGGGCRIEKIKQILDISESDIAHMKGQQYHCDCDLAYKQQFYDKMINLNEQIYQ